MFSKQCIEEGLDTKALKTDSEEKEKVLKSTFKVKYYILGYTYDLLSYPRCLSYIIINIISFQTPANLHKYILETNKRKTDLRDIAGNVKSDVSVNQRFEIEVFSSIAEELVCQNIVEL